MRKAGSAALALLVILGVAPFTSAETGTVGATRTLRAKMLQVVDGETEGTLQAVGRRNQWGSDDDPEHYLRLSGDFDVRFTYRVVRPPAIGRLALTWVLRGDGEWRFEAQDQGSRRWVTLATGSSAEEWEKQSRRVDVALLGAGSKLRVRLVGTSDALDVDLLVAKRTVWQPEPGTTWQWQLTGTIDRSYDVAMYDIDLFDVPERVIESLHDEGRIVVCYFSAGAWEEWRTDADRFPEEVLGADNGWPGERWLDVRRLDVLGPILEDRLDLAFAKGCDGVEPDNVDGYVNRSGFPLTAEDQADFNRWLAREAHRRKLSVGLKNDLDQILELVDHFDWALNEQCFQYDECELLLPFVDAGKAVFGVEYRGDPPSFCPEAEALGYSWLRKRFDLDAWVFAC
jgi:endo-alpha-1,4-polygalactosaminidase (GH114 family)